MDITSFIKWALNQVSHYEFIEEVEIYLMIERVTGFSKSQQLLCGDKELSINDQKLLKSYISERKTGKPLAVILSEKFFYKNLFYVDQNVLIPRPETEILVEAAIDFLNIKSNPTFIDIGCGSGCIGLSIALEVKNSFGVMVEKSPEAFLVAEKNLKILNASNVSIINADFNSNLFSEKFDLVVANPPYIAESDPEVDVHVRQYEPHMALFAEDHGLAFIKSWATQSTKLIKEQGMLIFEIGYTQGPEVEDFFKKLNYFRSIQIKKDYSENNRFVFAAL
jgi:release factor glutamine methyltransferase